MTGEMFLKIPSLLVSESPDTVQVSVKTSLSGRPTLLFIGPKIMAVTNPIFLIRIWKGNMKYIVKNKTGISLFYFCITTANIPIIKLSLSNPYLILIPWYGFFSNATTFELSILEPPSVDL